MLQIQSDYEQFCSTTISTFTERWEQVEMNIADFLKGTSFDYVVSMPVTGSGD